MAERIASLLRFWAACMLLSLCLPAAAETNHQLRRHPVTRRGFTLDADIDFHLNSRLEDAVQRGVALHFVLEAEITAPRWYWFDRAVVGRRLEYRLSYQPITRSTA